MQKDNQKNAYKHLGMTYKIGKGSQEKAECLLKAGLHPKVLCWLHWLDLVPSKSARVFARVCTRSTKCACPLASKRSKIKEHKRSFSDISK